MINRPVIEIDDLDKKKLNYSESESILRCKLASLYRLVHLNSWTSGIFNHITVSKFLFL